MDEPDTASGALPSAHTESAVDSRWTVVILTGGASRRMGRDKATATLGQQSLLEHVQAGIGMLTNRPVVIVGPEPAGGRDQGVVYCREDPAGGGPAAGIVAALPHVTSPIAALIATDMPFAGSILGELVTFLQRHPEASAAVARDAEGREQPLCAAYRTDALRHAASGRSSWAGAPLRALLSGLPTVTVAVTDAWRLRDVDTPADLAWAEGQHRRMSPRATSGLPRGRGTGILAVDEGTTMDTTSAWVARAAEALGITSEIDTEVVLDLARDVAHTIERPAAPLTTYLVGVAVGQGQAPEEIAATLRTLMAESAG